MFLNHLPQLLIDERISSSVIPGPRRDPATAEGAAEVRLLHSRPEACVTERVITRQCHRLDEDFHADPALAFRQGRDGIVRHSHLNVLKRHSQHQRPEDKEEEYCRPNQGEIKGTALVLNSVPGRGSEFVGG